MFGVNVIFFMILMSVVMQIQTQWAIDHRYTQQFIIAYLKAFHAAEYALNDCVNRLHHVPDGAWQSVHWSTQPQPKCQIIALKSSSFKSAYQINAVGFAPSRTDVKVFLQKQWALTEQGERIQIWQYLLRNPLSKRTILFQ